MALISIKNLTFCYDKGIDNVFENVSFQIDTNWKIGFVGRNGRGKTTFLKILMGELEFKGSVSCSEKFDYFPFEIDDKSKMAIEIMEDIVPNFEYWQLQKELNLLNVDEECLYRQFELLSGGEKTKIMLAALFLKQNNFLLIDEPTNHLDQNGRRILSEYLSKKKNFIVVSHDRQFLDGCVDHILSINRANIEVQKGNFSSWLANKEKQDSFEMAKNAKLEEEIGRLKIASKRSNDWADKGYRESTGGGSSDERQIGFKEFHRKKAGKLSSQAKALEIRQTKAIKEKESLLKNIETTESLKIETQNFRVGTLVDAANLSAFYGEKKVFSDLNFKINQGERIAIFGKNGSGKTTLLRLLVSQNLSNDNLNNENNSKISVGSKAENSEREAFSYEGIMKTSNGLVISYVPQDTSDLSGKLKDFAKQNAIDETFFRMILTKLNFDKNDFEKDVSELSNGEKKKVLIAKSLCIKAHLYVWDEPLNYIDILSRIQIEEMILNHQPTMIFVEHDKTFTDNIATKTILLS